MRHVLAKTDERKLTEQSMKAPNEQLLTWTDALFAKLRAIFGKKWIDQFAGMNDLALARQEWAAGLDGLTGEQIKTAIDHCRIELSWPPSISEFRKAALKKKNIIRRLIEKTKMLLRYHKHHMTNAKSLG